jgi:hypothetical protein
MYEAGFGLQMDWRDYPRINLIGQTNCIEQIGKLPKQGSRLDAVACD